VGVLWHRQERSIAFYKNGTELGTAFSDVEEDRLFPVVGGRGGWGVTGRGGCGCCCLGVPHGDMRAADCA
jgi:hypothetical protein